MVKRGEIWAVELGSGKATVPVAMRLCVVLTPSELNEHLSTLIVAPMSTTSQAAPFRVPLTHAGRKGAILLDQIQVVERARLKTRVGAVSNTTLARALVVLQELFAD